MVLGGCWLLSFFYDIVTHHLRSTLFSFLSLLIVIPSVVPSSDVTVGGKSEAWDKNLNQVFFSSYRFGNDEAWHTHTHTHTETVCVCVQWGGNCVGHENKRHCAISLLREKSLLCCFSCERICCCVVSMCSDTSFSHEDSSLYCFSLVVLLDPVHFVLVCASCIWWKLYGIVILCEIKIITIFNHYYVKLIILKFKY